MSYHFPPEAYNNEKNRKFDEQSITKESKIILDEKEEEEEEGEYIQDFTQEDYFQEDINYKVESDLAPVLFVIDFDHTLATNDGDYLLEKTTTKHVPGTYTRPFMFQFLDYIKSVNVNNIVIMWTAATKFYIYQNLLLLNLVIYFNHILHRKHCKESEKKYGKLKSYKYLIEKFPRYKNMRSVLIDNFAWKNGYNSGYNEILSIKPYCLSTIQNSFLESRGLCLGDTALVNLILYLENRFFKNIYNNLHNSDTKENNYYEKKYLVITNEGKFEIKKEIPLNEIGKDLFAYYIQF